MKLYTIRQIGHKDESANIPLPRQGAPDELATCTNHGKEYLRGTGAGWEQITHAEYIRLLEAPAARHAKA